MNKRVKKIVSLCMTLAFVFSSAPPALGLTDTMILTDTVENTYIGRSEGADMVRNLNFRDVPDNLDAKESIARVGALNLIKGYTDTFQPNAAVSNQEALAFILRALGLENAAQQTAVQLQGQFPADSPVRTLWSLGYLNLAMQRGLITRAQYADATAGDQTVLDPALSFVRGAAVTREQTADWIYRALRTVDANAFDTTATQQAILTHSDWESTDVDKVSAVEALMRNGVMTGENGLFRPKGNVTRAEMAQILGNLGPVYYNLMGITQKTGTVGGIRDNQYTSTGVAQLWRNFYIRTSDGTIDLIQYQLDATSAETKDVVVFKDGRIAGLSSLEEGDEIMYLTSGATDPMEALYIQVTRPFLTSRTVSGYLHAVNVAAGEITIRDASEKKFTYSVADGLYGTENGSDYLIMDQVRRRVSSLPSGSRVELTLKNNVVASIKYFGELVVMSEIRGIVIENDPDFGYLTIIDNNGNRLTKFYTDDIRVEKQQYYDVMDEIGYLNQMFPNFTYDPRVTNMDSIEPGDIVFIRVSPDDPDTLTDVSASTNYIMKYGKIRQFTDNNGLSQMLIEYEDKGTAWFDVADGIFISQFGRPIKRSEVKVGDWAKILVNQAVIAPGYVMESIKEMTVEGDGHFISTIVKGQLAGINAVQNQLLVQNAQTLGKTGWSNYKELQNYSIASNDIEYYYGGKQIPLDYALQYLKRASGEVYVALENNYAGERVKKVTFRDGRDETLPSDTVLTADGLGNFRIISNNAMIGTDAGTIVRRHGRLVDGINIMGSDYAAVSLNGGSHAAVVDITDAPAISGVMLARGRIQSVDEGKSFTVQSMAILSGNEWVYTPVQRQFAIDYNTLFLSEGGYVANETFLGYTDTTAINKVYNIVVDGTRAVQVIDGPYATRAVRGTIYAVTNGAVSIRGATYYNNSTGQWLPVSNTNATAEITIPLNSVIIKSNNIIQPTGLVIGDQIRVMTSTLPDTITGGMAVTGSIVLVEK